MDVPPANGCFEDPLLAPSKTSKKNFLFRVMSLDVRLAEVSGPAHLCVGDPLMDVPPANGCFEDPLLAPSKTSKKNFLFRVMSLEMMPPWIDQAGAWQIGVWEKRAW